MSPFNGHFPGGPGLASTRMSPFWILFELLWVTEVLVITGAIRPAKLQSECHNQQTNFITGRMPNQQCQSTEGKSPVISVE